MGVSGPDKLLYKSINLTWEHIAYIGHEIYNKGMVENIDKNKPTIDIDGNLLGFKFKDKAGGPVYEIMRCVDVALKSGFKVNVVVDGDSRHSAKRASYTRSFKREMHRLEAIDFERKLTISLQDGSPRESSNRISKQLQKARKLASNLLLPTFSEQMYESILNHNHSDLQYIKSKDFQADPIIAKRSIDGVSDVIWSSDSDFAVHNPNAILIKDFKYSRSSHNPDDIVLWTGNNSMVEKISALLKRRFPIFEQGADIFVAPKFPLFDSEPDYMCRAIIGCAIGCDFWEGGQIGVGASSIMK